LITNLFIFLLRKRGWRFVGPLPKSYRKAIIVYGPHRSWRDFFIAIWVLRVTGFTSHLVLKEHKRLSLLKGFYKKQSVLIYSEERHNECLAEWRARLINADEPFSVCIPFTWKGEEDENSWAHDLAVETAAPIVPVGIDAVKKLLKIHGHFMPSLSKNTEWGFIRNFLMRFPVNRTIRGSQREFES